MRGRIWALLLAVPESAVRVLICKTESYVDPHDAADGYAAFWASLRRAHSAGEPLPGVINVCEGKVTWLSSSKILHGYSSSRKVVDNF